MIESTPFHGSTKNQRFRAAMYQQGVTDPQFSGVTENATQTEIFMGDGNRLVFPRESIARLIYTALAFNATAGTAHLVANGSLVILTNASGVSSIIPEGTAHTTTTGTAGHHAFDILNFNDTDAAQTAMTALRIRVTGLANARINWATMLGIDLLGEPNNVSFYPTGV